MTDKIDVKHFRARPRTMEALIVERTGTYEVEGYGAVELTRGVYEVRPNVLVPLTQDETVAFWEAFEEDPTWAPAGPPSKTAWQRLL